jgi:hypothetical protein
MGSSTKSNLESYMVRENLKIEMLQIFIEMAQRKNIKLTEEEKEYVLDKTDELVDLYDVSGQYRSIQLKSEGVDEVEFNIVPIEDVEQMVNNFREAMAKLMFEVIKMGLMCSDYNIDK